MNYTLLWFPQEYMNIFRIFFCLKWNQSKTKNYHHTFFFIPLLLVFVDGPGLRQNGGLWRKMVRLPPTFAHVSWGHDTMGLNKLGFFWQHNILFISWGCKPYKFPSHYISLKIAQKKHGRKSGLGILFSSRNPCRPQWRRRQNVNENW